VQTTLSSLNLIEELELPTIIDSGAHYSYLILGKEDQSLFPLEHLEEPHVVEFADGSRITSHKRLNGIICIYGYNGESFRQSVRLWSIAPSESSKSYILIGRDLIRTFEIDVFGGRRAQIGDVLIFDQNQDEFMDENEQSLFMIHTEDQLAVIESEESYTLQEEDAAPLRIDYVNEETAPFGRPVIYIPWIGNERPYVAFNASRNRDRQTLSKLSREQKELYQEAVQQLLNGGFAKRLSDTDPIVGHHIAVRPVFKASRTTTKCRLCLDARQINRLTRTGACAGAKMLQCLLKFRTSPNAWTFDLDKAFWQIKLAESESKFYTTVINGERIRFQRLIFGGNYSPSALQQALMEILAKARQYLARKPEVNKVLGEPERPDTKTPDCWFYVDDFLFRGGIEEDLATQVQWYRWYLLQHGFASSKLRHNGDGNEDTHSYLGYQWETTADVMYRKHNVIPSVSSTVAVTRRDLFQRVMSFYDPLGFDLRTQLAGRLLVRDCATEQAQEIAATGPAQRRSDKWDLTISPDLQSRMVDWINFANSRMDQITRQPRVVDVSHLYIFCDASFQAWVVSVHGRNLERLASRGGLTPKGFTIPRAELLALHEGVNFCTQFTNLASGVLLVTVLTDSETCVHRLRNRKLDAGLKPYERNRITKIRESIKDVTSRLPEGVVVQFIPGELNLADYGTRPIPLIHDEATIHLDDVATELARPDPYQYRAGNEEEEIHPLLYMNLRSRKKTDPPVGVVVPVAHEAPVTARAPRELALVRKNRREQIEAAQASIRDQGDRNADGLIVDRRGKIVLTDEDLNLIKELISEAHGDHHMGRTATVGTLQQQYRWKHMRRDVKRYISQCETCCRVRLPRVIRTVVGNNAKWLAACDTMGPGAILGIDVCEMNEEFGFNGFITVTCGLSKWVRAERLTSQISTELCKVLGDLFYKTIFPRVIITDGAMSFKSRKFELFCIKHRIIHLVSPAQAPAYHGWFERPHKQLLDHLRMLVVDYPSVGWTELLPLAQFLVNSRAYEPNDETGMSPLHLVYNIQRPKPELMDAWPDEELLGYLEETGISHMIRELPQKYEEAGERLRKRQKTLMARYIDIFQAKRDQVKSKLKERLTKQPEYKFEIGTEVRVYRPKASKVAPSYSDPRTIVGIPSSATRMVQAPDGKKTLEYIANLIPITATTTIHTNT
jgi:hypothetical protein